MCVVQVFSHELLCYVMCAFTVNMTQNTKVIMLFWSTRIDRAMARVYRLTMLDFTNSKLSSSSAAFIEMLDRDSTLLRVDTQVALRIAKHGSGERSRGWYFLVLCCNHQSTWDQS